MEEKRIESAPIARGNNEEHLELMKSVSEILDQELADREADTESMSHNILSINNLFKEQLDLEDKAIIFLRKNELTSPIAAADSERDSINSGFRYYVRAYSFCLDPEKTEAARRIQVILDNYGNLNRRSYNRQSEATINLLEDINKYHSKDIDAIDAGWWIAQIEEKNNYFISLIKERFSLNVDRASGSVREIRAEVDRIYYRIATMLEAGYIINEGNLYGNIIDEINERLRYYKTTIATRKGRSDANKEEEISD